MTDPPSEKRLALGASPLGILRIITRQQALLGFLGLVVGVPGVIGGDRARPPVPRDPSSDAVSRGTVLAMSPIACHMEALSPAERARRSDVAAILQTRLAESAGTDAGIVFRWPGDDDLPPLIGEFVGLESRCCPFVRFRLDVSEEGGPIELQLSGRDGVKDFLVATFLAHR